MAKEIALQGALERLAPGPWVERADTPDGVVTAVRRLPPVTARHAPFPEAIDARLRTALDRRGITQLYSHQAEAIAQIADGEIGVHTYDGDTPQDARRTIRTRAHVVLSNPDMLHSGILPHHPRWAKLFENLRFIVIDELHAYRGVFGSHLCNVLRRLKRVARHYGSDPQIICSSATIANPRELAERLAERPFTLVAQSGAPRGEKFFV